MSNCPDDRVISFFAPGYASDGLGVCLDSPRHSPDSPHHSPDGPPQDADGSQHCPDGPSQDADGPQHRPEQSDVTT